MTEYQTSLVFEQLTYVRLHHVQNSDDCLNSERKNFESELGFRHKSIRTG